MDSKNLELPEDQDQRHPEDELEQREESTRYENREKNANYVPGMSGYNNFKNILMESVLIGDIPVDNTCNWMVTPCPKGIRTLVISNEGSTKCYSMAGALLFKIKTNLPGGNNVYNCIDILGAQRRSSSSVLDCIYNMMTNTMHVLDILSWNGHIMADGEKEFRHYWLKIKFEEGIHFENPWNDMTFRLLPAMSCDKESLQICSSLRDNDQLNGVIFFHKRGSYEQGESPLMQWLEPHKLEDVISILN